MDREWKLQKREYEQHEEESINDHQAILDQIKDSKNKIRKLQQ